MPGGDRSPRQEETESWIARAFRREAVKSQRVLQPQAFRSEAGLAAGQLPLELRESLRNFTQQPTVVVIGHDKLCESLEPDPSARNANHAHHHGARSEITC